MLAVEGDMPVTYVYCHTFEEGGKFGLNFEMRRFPVRPKKVMEMREHSPSCVCYCSQPPAAAENTLTPAIPSLDSSPCRTSLHERGRETPIMSPSTHAHPQGPNTPNHFVKLL